MCQHEQKNCPRCDSSFECKVGSISLCQCAAVRLNDTEREYIRQRFDDCLCAACMNIMKAEYHNKGLQTKINRLLGVFDTEK